MQVSHILTSRDSVLPPSVCAVLPCRSCVCPSDESEFVRCLSPDLRAICHWWDSLYVSLTPHPTHSWAWWSPLTPCDKHGTFIMSPRPPCHYSNSLTVWVTPLGGTPISHLEACLSLSLSPCMCVCIALCVFVCYLFCLFILPFLFLFLFNLSFVVSLVS